MEFQVTVSGLFYITGSACFILGTIIGWVK